MPGAKRTVSAKIGCPATSAAGLCGMAQGGASMDGDVTGEEKGTPTNFLGVDLSYGAMLSCQINNILSQKEGAHQWSLGWAVLREVLKIWVAEVMIYGEDFTQWTEAV